MPERRKVPDVCRIVGKRIASLRSKAGLTQDQLAEKIEADPSYLARIEIGQRQPSLDVLARIASQVGVPLGQLFPGWSVGEGNLRWARSARKLGEAIEKLSADDLRYLVGLAERLGRD